MTGFSSGDGQPRGDGAPVSNFLLNSNYPLLAWAECIRRGLRPDLVLIDGRFRVACFMATLLFAQPGCRILFDDYGDRPDCIVVERFVKPSSMAGRVAEFVVPGDVPRDDAWLAFVQACSDVT